MLGASEADLRKPDKTYHETFVQLKEQFPEMAAYHSSNVRMNDEDEALEKAIQQKVSSWAADEEEQDVPEGALDGCEASNLQCAMDDLEIRHKISMEKELPSIQQDYESLNQDQQRIVNNVVNSMNRNECINMVVSGEGGTGKTRVIHVIDQLISSKHSKTMPVVVASTYS